MTLKFKKTGIKSALLTGCLMAATSLSGCASNAVRYDANNLKHITDTTLRPDATPLETSTPLSLDDVRKRTLMHNSEYRRAQSQLMETIRKAGNRGKDILPRIYANSYGTWRNNVDASVGVKVDDTSSAMPVDFYTAQDKAIQVSNLTASWDLLEVGLSGFKAKRRTLKSFSEVEQNQYLCNKLVVDVEKAYWRTVAYERAEEKSEWLKGRITYALNLSKKRAEENPDLKLQELMFQRELIDISRWHQSFYRSLVEAKPELARLMNLPVGADFTLQSKHLPSDLGDLSKKDVLDLISLAYKHRPEIRQSLYKTDLTQLKTKEDLWRHVPAIQLFFGANSTSNSFVLNSNFASAGVSLSWDLLRLSQISETTRTGKYALANDTQEKEILASAVMAQVMIAHEQVRKLDYDLTLAWKALSVQGEITKGLNADFESGKTPETYLIKEELMRELSLIREQLARAELHTAKARLQQSIGIVPTCQAPVSTET